MALAARLLNFCNQAAHAGKSRLMPHIRPWLPSRPASAPAAEIVRSPYGVTEYLLSHPHWQNEEIFLVDVGASGGIHESWNLYGERLRAVGFDPLVAEVERLNRLNENPKIQYVEAFVGFNGYDDLVKRDPRQHLGRNVQLYQDRTSARHAVNLLNISYAQKYFNGGSPLVKSERHVELDTFFSDDDFAKIDFIKIDTDGHEMEVLLGADRLLSSGRVLGLFVEVQFQGEVHDHSSVFCNIDRFLRQRGFSLFDLEHYRYTKGVMPGKFLYDIPAQTHTGQTMFGDALYLRDLGDPGYASMWGWQPTQADLLKLLSLFELYKLPDCAAELLLNRPGQFPDELVSTCLDLLTPSGQPGSYRPHLAAFQAEVRRRWDDR